MRLEPNTLAGSFTHIEFQFHKGAIRTKETLGEDGLDRHFNSIKVRLELSISLFSACLFSDFNSIKVRLERLRGLPTAPNMGFQFHKGAIRTGARRLLQKDSPEFQFHKGAIRTMALVAKECLS